MESRNLIPASIKRSFINQNDESEMENELLTRLRKVSPWLGNSFVIRGSLSGRRISVNIQRGGRSLPRGTTLAYRAVSVSAMRARTRTHTLPARLMKAFWLTSAIERGQTRGRLFQNAYINRGNVALTLLNCFTTRSSLHQRLSRAVCIVPFVLLEWFYSDHGVLLYWMLKERWKKLKVETLTLRCLVKKRCKDFFL